jgi:3,4-dihydroxy 2-butanone 4-phosphate synthase / GTP cyclohydrolase II
MDQMSREYNITDQITAIKLQDDGLSKRRSEPAWAPSWIREITVWVHRFFTHLESKTEAAYQQSRKTCWAEQFRAGNGGRGCHPLDHIDTDHPEEKLDKRIVQQKEGFLKRLMLE